MMLKLSESIGSQYLPVIYELEEPGQSRLVGVGIGEGIDE